MTEDTKNHEIIKNESTNIMSLEKNPYNNKYENNIREFIRYNDNGQPVMIMRDRPSNERKFYESIDISTKWIAIVLITFITSYFGIFQSDEDIKLPFISIKSKGLDIAIAIFGIAFIYFKFNIFKPKKNRGFYNDNNYRPSLISVNIDENTKLPYTIEDYNREHNTNYDGFSCVMYTGSRYNIMENKVINYTGTWIPQTINPDHGFDAIKTVTFRRSVRIVSKWNTSYSSTFHSFSSYSNGRTGDKIHLPRGYGKNNYTLLFWNVTTGKVASVYASGSDAYELYLPNDDFRYVSPYYGNYNVERFNVNLYDDNDNLVLSIPNIGVRSTTAFLSAFTNLPEGCSFE